MTAKTYLISACLLGLRTRYDGGDNRDERVLQFCKQHRCIPVCPEQLGGLPTPRPSAEIRGGSGSDVLAGKCAVVDKTGADVSAAFRFGAEQVLLLVGIFKAKGAVLKSRSPSCGPGVIYDGTFKGRCRTGDGVTAALLKKHGCQVFSEQDLPGGRGV